MCAIAGWYAYGTAAAPVRHDALACMIDRMRYRGPDGSSVWLDRSRRLGLGHARLAVLDPTLDGAQPMLSPCGRFAVTFNGELYNYRSLRRSLGSSGFRFRSRSDTEVLLAAYIRYRRSCVHHLRGMFAFAVWDSTSSGLFLARDHFGMKPLYYTICNGSFVFASQVAPLASLSIVGRAASPPGCVGLLVFGSVPDPWTLYRDISAVPAGRIRDRGVA